MRVIEGDCVSIMGAMKADSVEIVVTSPPYNIGMGYRSYVDSRSDYREWTVEWLTEAIRVSRRGVMLNIDASPSQQTDLFLTLGAIAERFTIQNSIVWAKSITVEGVTKGHFKPINSRKYVNHTHEMIFHIVDRPTEIDRLSVGVEFADKSNIGRFKSNAADKRCGGSIWHVPYGTRNKKLDHPASFPLDLATKMILLPGGDGTVLDPFCGSGTTLRAASLLGRDAIGIEVDPHYAEISRSAF